jgi:nitroreductase
LTAIQNPVLDAIHSRRSVGKVTDEIPAKELIQQILDAALTAPNHHLTEPWRFFVLTGNARNRLGDALVEERLSHETEPDAVPAVVLEKIREKPLRAPVVIGVAVQPSSADNVWEVEEVCACAAATQNMLLAAHSLGLAAMWRTGDPCYSAPVKRFFGLGERDTLLGMIYVGYKAIDPQPTPRKSADHVTVWMDGE